MSESQFLKYQDKDGNGLVDACDDVVSIPPAKVCPDCTKDPAAMVPKWNAAPFEPFLNKQICEFQIPIITKYTTTIDESHLELASLKKLSENKAKKALIERFDEYVDEAIEVLLDFHNKDDSEKSISAIKEVIDYTEYHLDVRHKSRLMLLYSVPHDDLVALDDAVDETDEDDDEGDIKVTYEPSSLELQLIRVRKGLGLYSRYQKAYMALEDGQLYFLDSGVPFNLADYGDLGLRKRSIMADILPQLDEFLNNKGYNIRGVGNLFGGIGLDSVNKMEFTFTSEYKLKKLLFYTTLCGEKPVIYMKKLKSLQSKSAWKDPTAMAYFARLDDMERDLTARDPKPWLEFTREHTYPGIYSDINAAYSNADPENSIGSCVADALERESKQLGQDILDEVFGIGDAIAAKFHKLWCNTDEEEYLEMLKDLGLSDDPSQYSYNPDTKKWETRGKNINIWAAAKEQAYKEISGEQSPCDLLSVTLERLSSRQSGDQNIREFWNGLVDQLKKCGLNDLLFKAIECLMGGLSLEEALAAILKSALRAMSIEYFGDLFVGLPTEKQLELNDLVQKKLQSGELFDKSSEDFAYVEAADSDVADQPLVGNLEETWYPADKLAELEEESSATDTRRTLAKNYDSSGNDDAKSKLNPKVLFEAYIIALLEVYADDYLSLLDEMNKFPGAQLVTTIISMFRCPGPPRRDIFDFIHDFELPFCRGKQELVLPKLPNPAEISQTFGDLSQLFWQRIKLMIQQILMKILFLLMTKICELIGRAMCAALEATGAAIAAIPAAATGRSNLIDVFKESICGEDASDEQIEDTIVDTMTTLGLGSAALADSEQVLSFAEDISSATTRTELMNAFLGKPSEEFLTIVEVMVGAEYPDYADALGNKNKIETLFGNMGNLMPADFKQQMKDFVNQLPPIDMMPANPSLCATPEQIEQFCELRIEILKGRATEEQIREMCENIQKQNLSDLEQLSTALQDPNYIANNMPPVVSAPGCDDGLLPYESDSAIATSTSVLGGELELLKMEFSIDMLGNGPGKSNWGFINMILSDTMGRPYTNHMRKAHGWTGRRYVDFYVDLGQDDYAMGTDDDGPVTDGNSAGIFANVWRQEGAFPQRVAGWLSDYLTNESLAPTFESSNDAQADEVISKDFDDFGISSFKGSPQNLLMLPDLGYNVEIDPDIEDEQVDFTIKARKAAPDMTLSFEDNAAGETTHAGSVYNYGFDIEMYLADIEESGSTYVNRQGDATRIKITNRYNAAEASYANSAYEDADDTGTPQTDEEYIAVREFEFLAVDDTLSDVEIDLTNYVDFLSTFEAQQDYIPQVVLLKEILNEGGGSFESNTVKALHDEFMTNITAEFISTLAENTDAFDYGAKFDDLATTDIAYVTEDGESYFDSGYTNDDQVLGISQMQYDEENNDGPPNRVFYLDPLQFGGTYMNPPIYISPLTGSGWTGIVDLLFPEISPCKPFRTDLIDFGDIQDKIDEVYPNIPEDERLMSSEECVLEVPYNRILERVSAAGLEGLITAAIRIYVSVHFLKSLATFTTFYPKFPQTYSSIYAQYIVEDMEKNFKDAQKAGWEFFNPFKDEEFWYAFLEQSVQVYARRVDSEDIEFPSKSAIDACGILNDMQDDYDYPYREDLREEKQDRTVSFFKTLKNYRSEKNLQAVQETEELAKLVLKDLVMEQLEFMGEKFVSNLKQIGMTPPIFDLDYYLLTNLSQGTLELDLNKEIKEEVDVDGWPTEEESELYTGGGELYVFEKNDEDSDSEEGEEYIGYWHAFKNEEGELVYMSGEFHNEGDHDILVPFANKVTVPIGDVEEYEFSPDTSDTTKPFVVEKYISIDGTKYAPSTAIDIIKANDNTLNISDVYPGTLEVLVDNNGNGVGLDGELGIRYGLLFSMIADGTKVEITTVEVDALDLAIGQIAPFDGDSKQLLCLINLLKRDSKFKLISRYIFPLSKITSLLAIYNDFAFLPSIGQITVEKGAYRSNEAEEKPGSYMTDVDDNGNPVIESGSPGWANVRDRSGWSPFITTWDEWDQELLRNTNSRIKKLFKNHYNLRDFNPGELDDDLKPGKILLNELRERFKPAAGQRLLPWWRRRMMRSNPFNSEGELCEKD